MVYALKSREQLGERDAAIAAFRRARDAHPDDRHGASLRLMLLGLRNWRRCRRPMCARCLINMHRNSRAHWSTDLGYRGPALLFKAVLARATRSASRLLQARHRSWLWHGLAAAAFAKEVDHFIGFDLSPRMIEKARLSGLYAELEVTDMLEGLRGRFDGSADLILAADAMVYVADLAPVLKHARRVLAPGGLFAFTVKRMTATAS